jgi:hypothetical protein
LLQPDLFAGDDWLREESPKRAIGVKPANLCVLIAKIAQAINPAAELQLGYLPCIGDRALSKRAMVDGERHAVAL